MLLMHGLYVFDHVQPTSIFAGTVLFEVKPPDLVTVVHRFAMALNAQAFAVHVGPVIDRRQMGMTNIRPQQTMQKRALKYIFTIANNSWLHSVGTGNVAANADMACSSSSTCPQSQRPP